MKASKGICAGVLMAGVLAMASAGAQDNAPRRAADTAFAKVGETVITVAEYRQALAVAQRKKYYHAKPPEDEIARFQREVGADVVNRVLLVAEAKRRGIEPDRAAIDAAIAGYEKQYAASANWQANKATMIAAVTAKMEKESLLLRLEQHVRNVGAPTDAQLRAYYDQRKDRFVEPEQVKLSVILLKVDPSSTQPVWNAARDEANAIHKRLLGGASFAELAQMHSGDISAAKGGDMGYVHRGMLPAAVTGVVDALKPGAFSSPVQLLEGVAILRLDDRKVATQRAFDDVRARAAELWQREQGDAAWAALIAELRKRTPVWVDEAVYLPMPATAPPSPKPNAG